MFTSCCIRSACLASQTNVKASYPKRQWNLSFKGTALERNMLCEVPCWNEDAVPCSATPYPSAD